MRANTRDMVVYRKKVDSPETKREKKQLYYIFALRTKHIENIKYAFLRKLLYIFATVRESYNWPVGERAASSRIADAPRE